VYIKKNSSIHLSAGAAVGMICLCMCVAEASGATVYSLSPGDDIQAAIDASITGDTIQFAPGTYTVTSQLYIYNKGITLQGMGKALGTIIQRDAGSASDHRIFFIEGPTGVYNPAVSTVINGFTIKNGVAPLAGPENGLGGNIYVKEAPYTLIENSIIENGFAGQYGGGIDMEVGGTLRNSVVRNNTTANGSLNQGGGVYSRYGGNTIQNSIIYGNWADVGGGVAIQNGGINNDPGLGGADSRVRLINVTVADNFADGFSGFYGGGVGAQLVGKEAFITDSIVWDNLRTGGASDILNIGPSGGILTVNYTDTEVPNYGGTGNIYTDPQFTESGMHPWDHYKLQSGSPALTGSSINGIMGAHLELSNFQVPEPSTMGLLAMAAASFFVARRRRRA